jgi:glutamyl/glutaminyl-tRNA synthetase
MYNFACVIDDHFMEITHVIRGNDHVSNTPRQVLLYRALGWDCPAFAHIPMILGKDRERLSKRHGATSVDQYREAGYLPDALVNFLSLLSWSSESGEEILSRDTLVREFDFSRVSQSAAVFDTEKLDWMNGMYIRAMDAPRLS